MIKKLLLAVLLTTTAFITRAQQTISGTFSPAEKYNFGILYIIDVNNVFYRLDSEIKDGKISIETKTDMEPGMYRLVYNLPQTENFFDFIYNGKEDVTFTFSEIEGVVFSESKENQLWFGFKNGMDAFQSDIHRNYQEDPISEEKIVALFEMQKEMLTRHKTAAAGSIAEIFINAYTPYIPNQFETESDYLQNKKEQFFHTIDFSSSLFQKSALPLEVAIKYVFNFSDELENPKTWYIDNIDTVAAKIQSESDLFQKSLFDSFWQFLVNNEQVALANYLATAHLIPIATRDNDTAMVERLTLFKNLSLGEAAPNFSWEEDIDGKTVTKRLQNLDEAENYLLIFWSSTCSHCLAEVPKIHEKLKGQPEGAYKVIAIGLEDKPYDWRNAISDLPNFTHILGLGKWENAIGNAYDIAATPTYFVLDSDKKIVQKPESFEILMESLALDK